MQFIQFTKRTRETAWSMNELESHPYYEIYFLHKGSRTIFTENSLYSISRNTAVIIPPFTPHKTEGGPYERTNIYISDGLISPEVKEFLTANKTPDYFIIKEEYFNIINQLFQHACQSAEDSIDKITQEEMVAFFNTIIFFLRKSQKLSLKQLNIKNTKKDALIMQIVTYIKENPTEKITVSSLCKKFYLTESNLHKKFKSVINCTVGEYLSMIKIERAKELLYNTNKSIQQISEECGFSSQNYFALIFKQKCGVSPSGYRKTR